MKKANLETAESVEAVPGIFRKTLTYNSEIMLCHFDLRKGSKIPLHDHRASQNGFVMKGKLHFFTESSDFIAQEGDSYVFDPNEKHGCDVLEDSYVIEAFSPSRHEYIPKEE